MDDHIILLYF